ncbi:sulfotransferase [Catalinimonas sp. 4WD22]|uniref:sulfotransferase family protein n=1 Tax=Catalinimonas locisalis TaxID=3133978 RepID=UPI003100DB2A
MKKIFIVGAPRSGTTLTQSILAAHPQVFSTRETHFIHRMRRQTPSLRFLDHFFLHNRSRQVALDKLADQFPDLYQQYQKDRGACSRLADTVKLLDKLFTAAAHSNQKTHWVEKSPEHVGYIRLIHRNIEESVFIHTIRDPRDNIASLYDAGNKYADRWVRQKTVQQCIDRYKYFLSKSLFYLNKKGHFFLLYENLITQPLEQVEALYAFTELNGYALNVQKIDSGNAKITSDHEPWKKELGKGLQDTRLLKYNQLFDDAQKQLIQSQTEQEYQELLQRIEKQCV